MTFNIASLNIVGIPVNNTLLAIRYQNLLRDKYSLFYFIDTNSCIVGLLLTLHCCTQTELHYYTNNDYKVI